MTVVIRADAGRRIGSGHVMRCLTLATALRERGADVRFIGRSHDPGAYDRVTARGFPLTLLPDPDGSLPLADGDYASWLGVPQSVDASETVEALGGRACDLLVVDHYGLDRVWEEAVRPHTDRILVLDDLADRHHDADLLLDQNLRKSGADAYRGLVDPRCRVLSGPSYALVGPEYLAARGQREQLLERGRILAFFGGYDDLPLLAHTVAALFDGQGGLHGDLVVADAVAVRATLQDLGPGAGSVDVHGPQPDLARFMARSDVAIGAAGTATWERLCVGVPSVLTSVALNQSAVAESLARHGAIDYVGPSSSLEPDRLRSAVLGLLHDQQVAIRMVEIGQALVDGLGTARVLEALLPSPLTDLSLRTVEERDRGLLWSWANDTDVRSQSLDVEPIGWTTHTEWFEQRLGAGACRMYIMEAAGLPVGLIRFDIVSGVARIGYSLDGCARGRRWGSVLLRAGLDALREDVPEDLHTIEAVVRRDNAASLGVFTSLGFDQQEAEDPGLVRFSKPRSGRAAACTVTAVPERGDDPGRRRA